MGSEPLIHYVLGMFGDMLAALLYLVLFCWVIFWIIMIHRDGNHE